MSVSLTVRCTREEYMQFCKETAEHPWWVYAAGMLCLSVTAAEGLLFSGVTQLGLLFLLLGIVCLLTPPIILPMLRKGEGARRYDASDVLSQAMHLTFSDDTLVIHSAVINGTLPLSLISRVTQTKTMLAITFYNELTVCIPLRAMSEDEYQSVISRLT